MPSAAGQSASVTNDGMLQGEAEAGLVPGNMTGGIAVVYPGHNGEPFWTEWMGMQANMRHLEYICHTGQALPSHCPCS